MKKLLDAVEKESGRMLLNRVEVADSFGLRFMGLMGRKDMDVQGGLLLKNTSKIHTSFMRFTIDVIYLNSRYEILKIESVKPWKIGSTVKGAAHVLEVKEGTGGRFHEKMHVTFKERGE